MSLTPPCSVSSSSDVLLRDHSAPVPPRKMANVCSTGFLVLISSTSANCTLNSSTWSLERICFNDDRLTSSE
eukprot:CAMPEP_0198730236 /NCGR_PEP_ID=MMETSP1475-20131203/23567_1 /TAXON_ID= ORGANISM="Unidentified sp., Strain CCMP1999" /NCGR_SAMPLE_ID=MMETSP1475 /ASSEMBLY_ACC=CAM_ASM_001111 /LENGTH=71 /DNA_ID=CAMNT_0044493023 /DNA_START=392 /DNA_END=607 /DNA_ORIENTATION=-